VHATVNGLHREILVADHREAIWRRLRQAAGGDRAALRRVLRYVRLFGFNK